MYENQRTQIEKCITSHPKLCLKFDERNSLEFQATSVKFVVDIVVIGRALCSIFL